MILERDMVECARRVCGTVATRTPLLESASCNRRLGARFLLKAECLQKTGSFKYRAAYFRLSAIPAELRVKGAVAYSSGNFGAGLAAAGDELGVPVTIVAPADAPQVKLDNIKRHGARLVIVDTAGSNRERVASERAEELARLSGATLLHPFDDLLVMTSHAALALETLEQALASAARVDVLLVPCGGGGLAAAACWAVAELGLDTQVVGVEPSTAACVARSLASGERVTLEASASFCDALCAPAPGRFAFELLRDGLSGVRLVEDRDVIAAVCSMAQEFELTVEPSGALGLVAAEQMASGKLGDRVLVSIATGGNLDPRALHAASLAAGAPAMHEKDVRRESTR
jgi:threonine dehydratase